MAGDGKVRSISLAGLFLFSILLSLSLPAGTAIASNETAAGTITGTETWAGLHTVTGDVTVAPGAKLIINPGATITFQNGTHLDVRGSLCAGASSCGASSNANSAMKIKLTWDDPLNGSSRGECYGMSYANQEIWIEDPSCNEGVLMRSSIDLAETELRHVSFENAWGMPYYIQTVGQFRYAALVLDGASPSLTELSFSQINTSSVMTTNLAQPTFNGGNFAVGVGDDGQRVGSALQIYSSGSSVSPFLLSDITLTATNNGCGQQAGGRSAIWAEDSFIDIQNAEITGDYGLYLRTSAGSVTDSVMEVNCNGIDLWGKKAVGSTSFGFEISGNEITTVEGSGIYGAGSSYFTLTDNEIEGASQGSGIVVYNSDAEIHNNDIGPITGFFGLQLAGTYDVLAENNSIFETSYSPVAAGQYWSGGLRSASRVLLANNTISYGGTSICTSTVNWGGQFPCPVVHAYVTGVTMYDNTITSGGNADGIRAIGSLLDIQRNSFDVAKTGAVIKNYDSGYANNDQYGSLAYFSGNDWNDVESTYNVTKSSVTAQSEHIPSPAEGEFPVRLSWPDQEAWPENGFQGKIIPPPVKECNTCKNMTPRNFPLGVSMDNNSTVFTFADLTNLDLSKVKIATQPTQYAVQVSRAELVRFQTLIKGEKVSDALVVVEDALGNELYRINTAEDGFTPWVALPSNFHLDFRGLEGGDNPDGFADDEYEDSCSDGIDNDGDLLVDTSDPSCDYANDTREMSLYRYTAYRFGFGYYSSQFTLQEASLQVTAPLENAAPTVMVTQNDGHSFRRVVNITGNAHDGQLANSYATDELAQWDQGGYVHTVQVKGPFTSSWEDAGLAVDTSGSGEGKVTRFNRPFSSWYYEIDLSVLAGEGDYTFEFRSFDGIDYSPVVSRTIKLNTLPPTIHVTTPSTFSSHDSGSVLFQGYAEDLYGCPDQCNKDVGLIYIRVEGPYGDSYSTMVAPNEDGTWNYTWNFPTVQEVMIYEFEIWASDSDFCIGEIDECQSRKLDLTIDNRNSAPTISLNQPISGTRISSSEDAIIQGVARDFDGEITRVDIEIKDISNEYLVVSEWRVTDFSEVGEWDFTLDSAFLDSLRHDEEYLIRTRSYDGTDYSSWTQITITIDNPPNAGNNQPIFDSAAWNDEITLYCDLESNSVNKCTTAEIDLGQFFSDEDGDIQFYSVYDDPSTGSDDVLQEVINVGSSGIARYDPADMYFYNPDMDNWTLNNVIFIATDAWDSKANSDAITFRVVPLKFSIQEPDKAWFDGEEVATYTGVGLPGKQVSVSIGGVPVATALVSENGSWELSIPASRIKGDSSTPQFSYGGQVTEVSPISKGEPEETSSNLLAIGAIALLGILMLSALAFAGGLLTVEIDEGLDENKIRAEIPEGYGDEGNNSESSLEKYEDSPGWLWDPDSEQWVPDPNYTD